MLTNFSDILREAVFKINFKFGQWLIIQVSRYGTPYFYSLIFNGFLATCCGKLRNARDS